jgi:two-component system, probable response regulator PhcQ
MKRLLLVDDEPNVLAALTRAIRTHAAFCDVDIETFVDPYEALKRCSLAKFDVVVSDFRMPQLTGIEFLQALKEIAPDTVRIILSASTEFDTVRAAINEAAVFRFISKPWEIDDFFSQLGEAFALRAETVRAWQAPDQPQLSAHVRLLEKLEQEEPGLTKVNWGPNGEIIL